MLVDELAKTKKKRHTCHLIILDISMAFDKFDLHILCNVLKLQYNSLTFVAGFKGGGGNSEVILVRTCRPILYKKHL